jgi:quercetin dioxygenase-like cupin family protein
MTITDTMTITGMETVTDPPFTLTSVAGDRAVLSGELLVQIAAGLGHAAPIDALPSGSRRRWSSVIRAEQYEALIIAWPPGTGLAMHDHGGSRAALHIVGGRLRERFIDSDGRTRVRWLEAGDTVELGADHTHEVINLDDAEAISVHVYSPPLADDSFRLEAEIDIFSA